MARRIRWSTLIAVSLVFALAGTAVAAITWGPATAIPGDYAWNYSNSLEFTGTPGTGSFKLHEAFVSDNTLPQAIYYSSSANGTAWSPETKVSGADHAEGSSISAAGSTVIVGWMTWASYNNYDPADPRRVQVAISTNSGGSFGAPVDLSPAAGRVDYPIVAAAQTSAGATNLYAVWTDANTGKVKFRSKTNAGNWSKPITLGSSTADAGDGEGIIGFANIAAVDDLVFVSWISSIDGVLKSRAVNLNGVNNAAATLTNWSAITKLQGKISMKQNGYPIGASSPLDTSRVTMAWNTNTAQKYTTYDGTSIDPAGHVIFTNGTVGARTYTGGYSTVAEPAPGGGIVAGWGACVDTSLTNDCDYGKKTARFDLLVATSANGTTFGAPTIVQQATNALPLVDEPSIVVTSGKSYMQYNAYKASYTAYDVWSRVGTGNP